jgi:hypothetical protein
VDVHASGIITKELELTTVPTKNQLRRFFQEHLASDQILDLGIEFRAKSKVLLDAIIERLQKSH